MTVTARIAPLALLLGALPAPVMAQEGNSLLPGGATSLQETYGDWRVACTAIGQEKQCGLSQEHRQQDGRRVLGIEIVPDDAGGLSGAIVLPFGLHLDAGVTLAVDDDTLDEALRFSTCLPAGCLVPLALDGAATQALRSGEILTLAATINDSSERLSFSIPLAGFTAGLERTIALLN